MFETQNNYYIPLLFVGAIVFVSVLIYHSNKDNKDDNGHSIHSLSSSLSSKYSHIYNRLRAASSYNLKPHDSAQSLSSSMSSSVIERTNNSNIPNQKYRKQDPETRYDDDGTRYQCVSIPYRISDSNKVEIFMITSRNRGDYIFPGGGWEKDETGPQCAQREAWEEAGVRGTVTTEIVSDQQYTSDKGNKSRLWGYLLQVTNVEDNWPEPERRRKWMTIDEAEIALSQKRRKKFGALWRNGINYFVEQNLYHLPSQNQMKGKNVNNGYSGNHRSHKKPINILRSEDQEFKIID